jgi:hypothetical protein
MPSGRKIIRELEKRKAVKMEYPLPESIAGTTYTHEEIFGSRRKKLKEHYGVE